MKFLIINLLLAKFIFAHAATQPPDSLKHDAYYDCSEKARIKHELNPMIQRNASDIDIAKRVFELKMNDEDEHISSHCFYVCVFEYMGLIAIPGGKMIQDRKTVAFGEKLRKRVMKKCLDIDEMNLCKRIDFFLICLLDFYP
ncbi:hypothetical protein GQX74_002255 [Glossina fuscipes]|nr:hypothetical protein GQX74_002255 [Glossina fuscipes]